VRGERLADELGLSVDPMFEPGTSVRRAIEVYPHPAIVALFNLALTIKYKAKSGRTSVDRALAFDELMNHLESLGGATPSLDVRTSRRWEGLRELIASDATGAALDRAEDEIDAYLCAEECFPACRERNAGVSS
jgi:predicted RNase H-like nuclease